MASVLTRSPCLRRAPFAACTSSFLRRGFKAAPPPVVDPLEGIGSTDADFGSLAVKTVGVVGAGQMGTGIAQVLAEVAQVEVLLYDANPTAAVKALNLMHTNMRGRVSRGQMVIKTMDEIFSRIKTTSELKTFERVDFVLEAVFESSELKKSTLRHVASVTRPEVVLASNTASIPITRLASATSKPDKVVGMHFMQPVVAMPLVELVPGLDTSEQTLETAFVVAEMMGKTPIKALDSPGFISFRILMAFINEAAYVLQEGVGSARDVDSSIKLGTRSPMGPLELADFIGLDTCVATMRVLHQDLGQSKYSPCPLLVKYVEAGRLGRKSGRGFHVYKSPQ